MTTLPCIRPALRITAFIIATVAVCQLATMVRIIAAWKWIAAALILVDFGLNASARLIAWVTINLSTNPPPSADNSLYLRSFKVDNSTVYSGDSLTRLPVNDRILRHMTRVAPPRKIINTKRPLDVEDGDVSDLGDDWIEKVKPYAFEADLVVICLSETERGGLLDELEMVSQTNIANKAIVMYPPLSTEFRSEWAGLRSKIAARFASCSSPSALIEAILDADPELHTAIFLGVNGQPQKIKRLAHGDSAKDRHDPPVGRWTWDEEVGHVFDEYMKGCLGRQSRLRPIAQARRIEFMAWIIAFLGFSLTTGHPIADGIRSFDSRLYVASIAATVLIVQFLLCLEWNWRLRAALRISRFWVAFVPHFYLTTLFTFSFS